MVTEVNSSFVAVSGCRRWPTSLASQECRRLTATLTAAERLTASVKCPVCVCVQESVSLSRLVLIPDTCWATVNCMHDSGEPSCQPCAVFSTGFSERTCPSRLVHHGYLSGRRSRSIIRHLFFFFWVLSQGTLFGAEGTSVLFPALLLMDRPASGCHQYQGQPHDQQDHRNHLGLREIVVRVRHPGSSHSDHQRDDPKWKDAAVPRLLHPSRGLRELL